MTGSYCLPAVQQLIWVVLVAAAFVGWGREAGRWLRLRTNAGLRLCLGMAAVMVLLSWLIVAGTMSRPVAIALVAAGALLGARELAGVRRPRVRGGLLDRGFLGFAIVIATICVALSLFEADFQMFDDYGAYLVFPKKLLDMGAFGIEPFSERRLATGLGGYYALQSLILAGAGPWFLRSLDPGIALLALMLMFSRSLALEGARPGWAPALLIACALMPPFAFNLTAQVLPVTLIVALFFVASAPEAIDRPDPGWRQAAAIALIVAALLATKPVYLVVPAIFLTGLHLWRLRLHGATAAWAGHAATIVAFIAVLLAPWMLIHWRDTGTPLYPLLGMGFSEARYGDYPRPWQLIPPAQVARIILGTALRTSFLTIGLPLALGVVWMARRGRSNMKIAAALMFAAAIGLFVEVGVAVGGEQLRRYSYPGLAAALLVLLYSFAVDRGTRAPPARPARRAAVQRVAIVLAGGVFAVMQIVPFGVGLRSYYLDGISNARTLFDPSRRPGSLFTMIARGAEPVGEAVRRLQDSVPAGATFLEHMDYPFLLDFGRNEVLVADWPGAAGPPPGVPYREGPEALANYLLANGIRYVAFGLDRAAYFPQAYQLYDRTTTPWSAVDVSRGLDFDDNLELLSFTRALVFHDRSRVMIDLATPAGAVTWATDRSGAMFARGERR